MSTWVPAMLHLQAVQRKIDDMRNSMIDTIGALMQIAYNRSLENKGPWAISDMWRRP